MRPSPWTFTGVSAESRERHARVRFGAALLGSALIHALLSAGLTSGSGRVTRISAAPSATVLEAALVIPASPLAIAMPEPDTRPEAPARVVRKTTPVKAAGNAEVPNRADRGGLADTPDAAYYGARQLDVYPVLTGGLDLSRLGATGAAARVLVLVLIDVDGRVNEVSVVEAEPRGAFDESARGAFAAARFKPALKDGRPVKSRLLVEVDFSDREGPVKSAN